MAYAKVHLDCRNSASNPNNGYTNTSSSKSTTYSYQYTGGNDPNCEGGVIFPTGRGVSVAELSVGGDSRYHISNVFFSGDNITDLSWTQGETATSAFIVDTDVNDLNDEYTIEVTDTVAKCTFICDPPIKNEPD